VLQISDGQDDRKKQIFGFPLRTSKPNTPWAYRNGVTFQARCIHSASALWDTMASIQEKLHFGGWDRQTGTDFFGFQVVGRLGKKEVKKNRGASSSPPWCFESYSTRRWRGCFLGEMSKPTVSSPLGSAINGLSLDFHIQDLAKNCSFFAGKKKPHCKVFIICRGTNPATN